MNSQVKYWTVVLNKVLSKMIIPNLRLKNLYSRLQLSKFTNFIYECVIFQEI